MSEPLDPKRYEYGDFNAAFKKEAWALGLAPLKEEGERLLIPGLEPGPPPTRWERLSRRLRATPHRLWWAFFGDEYY